MSDADKMKGVDAIHKARIEELTKVLAEAESALASAIDDLGDYAGGAPNWIEETSDKISRTLANTKQEK